MSITLTKPAHEHDCDGCEFLGSMRTLPSHPRVAEEWHTHAYCDVRGDLVLGWEPTEVQVQVVDLYVCQPSYRKGNPSLIVRLSSEGSEYHSLPLDAVVRGGAATYDPYFGEALRRWVARTNA